MGEEPRVKDKGDAKAPFVSIAHLVETKQNSPLKGSKVAIARPHVLFFSHARLLTNHCTQVADLYEDSSASCMGTTGAFADSQHRDRKAGLGYDLRIAA